MERNPAFSLATEWPIFSERAQLVGDERFRRKQSAIRLEIASSHDSLLERTGFELLVPLKGDPASATIRSAAAPLVGAKQQHLLREGPVVRILLPPAVSLRTIGSAVGEPGFGVRSKPPHPLPCDRVCDRDAPQRKAPQEIVSAVDRIDDPAPLPCRPFTPIDRQDRGV